VLTPADPALNCQTGSISEDEEPWLAEMAWVTPQFSKVKVNRAGEMMVRGKPADFADFDEYLGEYFDALDIVNNWRSSHSFPMNTFTVGLKRRAKNIDSHCIIAQRIKRMSSIELKLRRYETMTLSQMQDLGGCRAIMSSVSGVSRLVREFRGSDIKHPLQTCDDYIGNPKASGYRGVHLIYRYNSDRKKTYNSLKIEMQIRTQLQHAWATAVETVGTLQRQALKSSQGDADWLRFFALTSSAFAFREKTVPIPETPGSHRTLVRELREYVQKLDLANRLSAYGSAMRFLSNPQHGKSDSHYFLLELNPAQKSVEVTTFKLSESKLANAKYLDVEKKMKERPGSEAVLVSVDSLDTIRKAYPNYFLDTDVFMNLVADATKTIAPKAHIKRPLGQLRLF
jgi:ppGpp synthetase/RelA/SpoT-type nucleotidyltranferase